MWLLWKRHIFVDIRVTVPFHLEVCLYSLGIEQDNKSDKENVIPQIAVLAKAMPREFFCLSYVILQIQVPHEAPKI